MKRVALLAIASVLISTSAFADVESKAVTADKQFSDKEEAKLFFDGVMKNIVLGNVSEAFDVIQHYFPLEETEFATMKAQMTQQRALMKQRFGPSLDFTYYGEEALQDIFVKYTYIEKFEKHAIRWSFVIYKPKDKWIVNAVFFDDKVLELLRR